MENGYAERSGFVETVFLFPTPGVARRSASLSNTFSGKRRVKQRSCA